MRLLVSQCRHYRGRGTNGLVPSNSWWNGWLSAIIVKKGKLLQTQDHYNDSLDWFLSNWPWTSLVMILCHATFFKDYFTVFQNWDKCLIWISQIELQILQLIFGLKLKVSISQDWSKIRSLYKTITNWWQIVRIVIICTNCTNCKIR